MMNAYSEQEHTSEQLSQSLYVSEPNEHTESFVSVQYHFVASLADDTNDYSIWDVFF